MACSPGSLSKLAFDADSTFDASSEPVPFLYETIGKKGRVVGARGITGSRDQIVTQTRLGSYAVGGRVAMYAAPDVLDNMLPRILGAAESTDLFAISDTLPSFSTKVDRVGAVFRYDNCAVARAFIQAKAGPMDGEAELAQMAVDIIAQTETTDGISWEAAIPDFSTAANAAPYIMSDAVVTINSGAYPVHNILIGIDNHIQPRWVNSLTATSLCPQDRTVVLRTSNPFTATEYAGLYELSTAIGGVAATVVFTNGSMSLTFTFSGLQWADVSPNVMGKREIPLNLSFVSRGKGSSASISVTNDSTA